MNPFIYIEKNNISKDLCDVILLIEDPDIPLDPDKSSPWFDIINQLVPKITSAVSAFIAQNSLDVYNMKNIIDTSTFLQNNMVLHRSFDTKYHNDFIVINKTHATLSYMWCLGSTVEIMFGKLYKKTIEKGDLILFPASWEYPYKLDPTGIYLKGTLYTSYE